jgi:hypothetical protein
MGKSIDSEISKLENEVLMEKFKTELNNAKLIRDLRGSLGVEIKKNPRKIKLKKLSFLDKLMITLRNMFTKF